MDIYETVTSKIVEGLKNAQRWQKPWTSAFKPYGDDAAPMLRPMNAITGKAYHGINVPMLWASQAASPYWATYKAWSSAGAQVRKGEKATHIVFWKRLERQSIEGDDKDARGGFLMARGYAVFNATQVDGWQSPATPAPIAAPLPVASPFAAHDAAEAFIAKTGAKIVHGGNRAYYTTGGDFIAMPPRENFIGTATSSASDAYYSVLFHELTHWTGNASRCARKFGQRFGDQAYAAEELVAELGAAFLCADQLMLHEPRADHAAYIATWIRVLENDKRAIFTASSKAEEAVRYIAGTQEEAQDALAA